MMFGIIKNFFRKGSISQRQKVQISEDLIKDLELPDYIQSGAYRLPDADQIAGELAVVQERFDDMINGMLFIMDEAEKNFVNVPQEDQPRYIKMHSLLTDAANAFHSPKIAIELCGMAILTRAVAENNSKIAWDIFNASGNLDFKTLLQRLEVVNKMTSRDFWNQHIEVLRQKLNQYKQQVTNLNEAVRLTEEERQQPKGRLSRTKKKNAAESEQMRDQLVQKRDEAIASSTGIHDELTISTQYLKLFDNHVYTLVMEAMRQGALLLNVYTETIKGREQEFKRIHARIMDPDIERLRQEILALEREIRQLEIQLQKLESQALVSKSNKEVLVNDSKIARLTKLLDSKRMECKEKNTVRNGKIDHMLTQSEAAQQITQMGVITTSLIEDVTSIINFGLRLPGRISADMTHQLYIRKQRARVAIEKAKQRMLKLTHEDMKKAESPDLQPVEIPDFVGKNQE